MATIRIDNRDYEVDERNNLLHVALSLGFDLPYFCWHPAMGSVGACRQCAVKQYQGEDDDQGQIVMACMTPAADGTRIAIEDEQARDFRASVIEWLMINHPHDCPVCEEGGECHLQDMTQMTGHTYRRYRFGKRTHRNQYLGPFIAHEMNRCIACYRCVRFYQDYAGGRDLQAFAAHHDVYFGREADGTLESEFSGNLVEVCPTGVFTDKTLSLRYTRKWDLRSSPSVCHHCGLGCSISPNERYDVLKRVLNRYNHAVNGYFICDRGRFGTDYVNADTRVREPWLRTSAGAQPQPAGADQAREAVRDIVNNAGECIGIGSPRASLESNFALRELVGADNFYDGLSEADHRLVQRVLQVLREAPVRTPPMRETESADAVLVLGEDLPNTAPRLALSLRQATRMRSFRRADELSLPRWQDAGVREATPGLRSPLYLATPAATRLDDVAERRLHGPPQDTARLGFAVAHALSDAMPAVPALDGETQRLAEEIAETLLAAESPLIVSGLSCRDESVIQAAANVAAALAQRRGNGQPAPTPLTFVVPEANTLGLSLLGGQTLDAGLQRLTEGDADTAIVLENDLYQRAPGPRVDKALDNASLVALEHTFNHTLSGADVILPAATFAEADGTLVSNEGRAQRFFAVLEPDRQRPVAESWRWLASMVGMRRGRDMPPWVRLDEIVHACAEAVPALAGIVDAAPDADYRIAGNRIAREPHRYSGRTAMHADESVHEPWPPQDPDSPFSFTMEGHQGESPPSLQPFFWAPGWNSEQAVNKFQDEVDGPLHSGDPGVRLIEPQENAGSWQPFDAVPAAFTPRPESYLGVPLHEVFGSDEMSARSEPLAERIPQPYVALNPQDADTLGLEAGERASVELPDRRVKLTVRVRPELAPGTAGLPAGLSGLGGAPIDAWVALAKEQDDA